MLAISRYSRFLPSKSALFSPDSFERDLARDFLFIFSRAEFSLKASGFVKAGRFSEPIVAWSSFASEIEQELNSPWTGEPFYARQYLHDYPPKKQIVSGRTLEWQERKIRDNQTPAQFLIESMTQVRHNLFHGGKELAGRLTERDRTLIHSAIIIAALAVSAHSAVSAAFDDAGPRLAA